MKSIFSVFGFNNDNVKDFLHYFNSTFYNMGNSFGFFVSNENENPKVEKEIEKDGKVKMTVVENGIKKTLESKKSIKDVNKEEFEKDLEEDLNYYKNQKKLKNVDESNFEKNNKKWGNYILSVNGILQKKEENNNNNDSDNNPTKKTSKSKVNKTFLRKNSSNNYSNIKKYYDEHKDHNKKYYVDVQLKTVKDIISETENTKKTKITDLNTLEDYKKFQNEALELTNIYRKNHHVPPLKLNPELNEIAINWANHLAEIGDLEHSDNSYKGDILGENIFMCYGEEVNGKEMVKDWYDEIHNYNFKEEYQIGKGHFSQMIWKDSKEVGFGFAVAEDGSYFGVANYYPAGNIMGLFVKNVLPV